MQQRRYAPLFVVLGLLAVTAIVLAVSVDVYDSLFWVRFGWSLAVIVIGAVGVFRAVPELSDKPVFVRSIATILLYVISMVVLLSTIKSAKLMFVVALAESGLYCLILFLSAGIARRY